MGRAHLPQGTVEVHAPAPTGAPQLPGCELVRCSRHPSIGGRCYEVRLEPGQRLYLGRPDAGSEVLPLEIPGPAAATWAGMDKVSAVAALVRLDERTQEVLVTNLSRNHAVLVHGEDGNDRILTRTALGDRHRRWPDTAVVREGSARIEVHGEGGSPCAWVMSRLDAAVAWRRLLPSAADARAGGTRRPPEDRGLQTSTLARLEPGSKAAKDGWRDRRTAFTVALARTPDGRRLLRQFLQSTPVRQRVTNLGGGEVLAVALDHLDRADSEGAAGGVVREPGPLFVAVDLARGATRKAGRRSADRNLEALWNRLHDIDVVAGVAVTTSVDAGSPGGSGVVHADLLEMVQRHLGPDPDALRRHLSVDDHGTALIGLPPRAGLDR